VSERSDVSPGAVTLTHPASPASAVPRPSPVRALETVDDVDAMLQAARALFAAIPARQVSVPTAPGEASMAMAEATSINALLRHCGCVAGSVGGSVGLVCALAGLWLRIGGPGSWQVRHLAGAAAFALAMSLTAKFWSHVRARQRLIAHLLVLRGALATRASAARPAVAEV
jgi:hypothetical protein